MVLDFRIASVCHYGQQLSNWREQAFFRDFTEIYHICSVCRNPTSSTAACWNCLMVCRSLRMPGVLLRAQTTAFNLISSCVSLMKEKCLNRWLLSHRTPLLLNLFPALSVFPNTFWVMVVSHKPGDFFFICLYSPLCNREARTTRAAPAPPEVTAQAQQ